MKRTAVARHALLVAAALIVILAACTPITPPTAVPSLVEQAPAPSPVALGLEDANVRLSHVVALPNAIAMATRPNDDSLYFATQDGVVQRFRKGRLYPGARHQPDRPVLR